MNSGWETAIKFSYEVHFHWTRARDMEDATFTHLVLGYILLCWHFGFLSRYIPLSVHAMSRRHSVCGGRTGPISWPAPRPLPASLPPLALFPGRQHAWTFSSVPAPNTRPPPATISLRPPSPLGSPVSDLCLPPSLSPNSFFDHLQADFSVATKKVPLEVPGTFQTTNLVAICQHVSFGTFRPQ